MSHPEEIFVYRYGEGVVKYTLAAGASDMVTYINPELMPLTFKTTKELSFLADMTEDKANQKYLRDLNREFESCERQKESQLKVYRYWCDEATDAKCAYNNQARIIAHPEKD